MAGLLPHCNETLPWVCAGISMKDICGSMHEFRSMHHAAPPRRKPPPVSQICGGKKSASSELRAREGYASITHRWCSPLDALRKYLVTFRQCLAPAVPHRAVLVLLSWQRINFLWNIRSYPRLNLPPPGSCVYSSSSSSRRLVPVCPIRAHTHPRVYTLVCGRNADV